MGPTHCSRVANGQVPPSLGDRKTLHRNRPNAETSMWVPSTRMAPGSSFPAGPNRMSFMRSLSGNPPIPTTLLLLFLSADLQGPSRLLTQLLRKLREIDCHSCLGRFELQRCIWSEQTYELNSSDIFQSYTVTGPVR